MSNLEIQLTRSIRGHRHQSKCIMSHGPSKGHSPKQIRKRLLSRKPKHPAGGGQYIAVEGERERKGGRKERHYTK